MQDKRGRSTTPNLTEMAVLLPAGFRIVPAVAASRDLPVSSSPPAFRPHLLTASDWPFGQVLIPEPHPSLPLLFDGLPPKLDVQSSRRTRDFLYP
jgi:hypothetical protein